MTSGGTFSSRWWGHGLALLIFFAVSLSWSMYSQDRGPEAIRTSDTTDVFYGIVIGAQSDREATRGEPASLVTRIVQGQREAWRDCPMADCYHELFNAFLKSVYLATGDITDAYKLLVLPLNFIFLVGSYLLFLSLCRQRGLAILFALLASLPIAIPLAGEVFGIGPYTIFSRRHLFTAFVPLALYGFYRYRDDFRALLLVFASLGIIANLHASGILLIEIVLLAYLLFHARLRPFFLQGGALLTVAFATAFIALGSPWRVLAGFIEKLVTLVIPAAQAASFDLLAGIDPSARYLFYPPHIYAHLPSALVHAMSLGVLVVALLPLLLRRCVARPAYGWLLFLSSLSILAFIGVANFKLWLLVAAAAWLFSQRKDPTPALELTSLLILATYLVSFVLSVVLQFAYLLIPDFPAIQNNLRGVRFFGILLFVWLVALLGQIDLAGLAKSKRYVFVLLLVVATLFDLRQAIRDNFRELPHKEEKMALLDVARWAKVHTPRDASIYVASSEFGIVSERRIRLTNKLRATCSACDGVALANNADALIEEIKGAQFQYAVLRKATPDAHTDSSVYENRHYALLRVD